MRTAAEDLPRIVAVLRTRSWLLAIGRCLMSLLFIWDGIVQLLHPDATVQYFAQAHVPAPQLALWVSVPIHVLGGLALLVGLRTRAAATLLALLAIGTAFGVHLPAGDPGNLVHFYKNLAIAGGLLYVIVYGAGGVSIER
jgi:putative oxidoreductase